MKILSCILLSGFFIHSSLFAQDDPVITKLFQDTYQTIKAMRLPNGIYIDKLNLSGDNSGIPGAMNSNGVGLISLCIADAMYKKTGDSVHWEAHAGALAEATIMKFKSFSESPATSSGAFFHRYFDPNTGRRYGSWSDEYSTIDNALFAVGLIFCRNYFVSNPSTVNAAESLLNSMDFTSAISADGRTLFMVVDSSGIGSAPTHAFNEYMIVSWLAKNVPASNPGFAKSQTYWNTYCADPTSGAIPKSSYNGIEVLTDNSGYFLSNFIPEFCNYYCHYFRHNPDYMNYFGNARKSDSVWWENNSPGRRSYEWGLGAGEDPGGGYTPVAINSNSRQIVSPQIIAGFIPVYPQAKADLKTLLQRRPVAAVYTLPGNGASSVLWRYSRTDTTQRCKYIQAVDISTMLYGLAMLPEYLGPDIFDIYNDLPASGIGAKESAPPAGFALEQNYPNPFNPVTNLSFTIPKQSFVSLKVYDVLGREVATIVSEKLQPGNYMRQWNARSMPSGVYFCRLETGMYSATKKIVLMK